MKLKKHIKLAALLGVVSIAMLVSGCDESRHMENPKIYEVELRGHEWLVFRTNNYGQTYVHSPECKCLLTD